VRRPSPPSPGPLFAAHRAQPLRSPDEFEAREALAAAVPESHRDAAEHIRSHLVHLRGGAPFLSSADALTLIQWLDDEVPVPHILAALDRALASRRKNNARRPLTLTAAKRHIGKPPLTPVALPTPTETPTAGPPTPRALEALFTDEQANDPVAADLLKTLAAIPAPESDAIDAWVTACVAACRDAQERRWQDLDPAVREARMAAAITEMGDIASIVDEDTLHQLAEEIAREQLRTSWPRLDTATFLALAPTPGRAE
jgi:hypothetical protein